MDVLLGIILGTVSVGLALLSAFFWKRARPSNREGGDGERAAHCAVVSGFAGVGFLGVVFGETATIALVVGAALAFGIPRIVRWWRESNERFNRQLQEERESAARRERERPEREREERESTERRDLCSKMSADLRDRLRDRLRDSMRTDLLEKLRDEDEDEISCMVIEDTLDVVYELVNEHCWDNESDKVVREELAAKLGLDLAGKVWEAVFTEVAEEVRRELASEASTCMEQGIDALRKQARGVSEVLPQFAPTDSQLELKAGAIYVRWLEHTSTKK